MEKDSTFRQAIYQKANGHTTFRLAISPARLKYWDPGGGFGLNTLENITPRLTYMAQWAKRMVMPSANPQLFSHVSPWCVQLQQVLFSSGWNYFRVILYHQVDSKHLASHNRKHWQLNKHMNEPLRWTEWLHTSQIHILKPWPPHPWRWASGK